MNELQIVDELSLGA